MSKCPNCNSLVFDLAFKIHPETKEKIWGCRHCIDDIYIVTEEIQKIRNEISEYLKTHECRDILKMMRDLGYRGQLHYFMNICKNMNLSGI